ncbi:MAG TPA: substrate-binding domain-containing protein, partial [Bacillota bacterium]|nr:substrate-binding domain-containing protein [Bacillota bacterium]
MRRLLLILLAICLFAGASACNFIKRPPTGGDVTAPVPGPAAPDTGEGPAATACEEIALRFSEDEWPRVDGATAFLPFYQEMAARMLGISSEEAGKKVLCSTTDWAYPYLHQGKVDIVFCLRPSADQVLEAANAGVRFEEVPFANEGFVFFVNKNNPVDSLSVQQLHDIYAGKITNWKEVGGSDEPIIAYQRSEGSGSQTGLYLHVISPEEVMEPPTERRIGTMGEIIDAVAGYKDAEGALGYSYRYFV